MHAQTRSHCSNWHRTAPLTLMLLLAGPHALSAQQADVIRGRVRSSDGSAIERARVVATSIPGNVEKATTTGRDGRYSVVFPNGSGDYWIVVTSLGHESRRFELKRLADEAVLVGDVTLTRVGAVLDEVQVRAERLRPPRAGSAGDISGTEKSVGAAAVDPTQAGDLAAMAATLPGVQLIPGVDGASDQFSVFGLSGEQNQTTLNGLAFGGSTIPRDAATRVTLSTSPWDVARGGFSGAQMGLSTQAGSNFSTRGISTLLNDPSSQWMDRAARSLGAPYRSASIGAATAGPIRLDRSFYSFAYQFDRRTSDRPTLPSADGLALQMAGVSPDSLRRFLNVLDRIKAPVTAASLPTSRVTDRGLVLGNFDWAPATSTTGQALTLTVVSSMVKQNAAFSQITGMPTNDVRLGTWLGAVQGRQTMYLPSGVLSETSSGFTQQRTTTSPFLAMPSAGVRVNSVLPDGTSAIAGLTFAGSPMQRTASSTSTASLQNQLSWFSLDSRHRIQVTSSARYERFTQDVTSNVLGNFYYNSLADLEAGRPTMFTRSLRPRVRRGALVDGAIAIGDAMRVRPGLQVQYGVRFDANRFLAAPEVDAAVRTQFGVDNADLPNRISISPRMGFAWTYGQAPQLALGEGFARTPRAVVRGGIGVFQNMPGAATIGSALALTGSADANAQLICVGAAAPPADWPAFQNGTGRVPDRCADGSNGTAFGSAAPDVWLFDAGYRAPRSTRANLNWAGPVFGGRLLATLDIAASRTSRLASAANLNFDPTVRFALANEAQRPVFTRAQSIIAATGAVSALDSRRDAAFGVVTSQRSDLASQNGQVMLSLQPAVFRTSFAWSASYVWSSTRDAVRGFQSTTGDPRQVEWARGALDSRHQVVYQLSWNIADWVPVSLNGSVRSGRPYTPMVGADINGDGARNDRAFVFDPARIAGQDPTLAAAMQTLMSTGSASARACLTKQRDRLASRASCQEPWSSVSTLTLGLNPVKFRLPQRLNVSFFVNNPLGAVDLALHGESGRRGWGQPVNIDQTLLYVRGFDAASSRFLYEVNPRFGATSPRATVNRNPVVVTAQFRYDIGFTRERQLLTQSLDRGRRNARPRATTQDVRGMSNTLLPPNPMAAIMRAIDSLQLTRAQADEISAINRRYTLALDSIWVPVATYLTALPGNYQRAEAYDRYQRARERTIDRLLAVAPTVRALLTASQRARLAPAVQSSLDPRYLRAVRSSTAGGANMGALGLLAQMGWTGASIDPSAAAVMIHR